MKSQLTIHDRLAKAIPSEPTAKYTAQAQQRQPGNRADCGGDAAAENDGQPQGYGRVQQQDRQTIGTGTNE
ncbi:MAG TPA: hypothetical protein VK457_16730 [Chloroflexota bacterium]|nr:hypothetical protein [Chloroflexota bacterium]